MAATALTPLATAILQFATVPIFLHAWGPAKYGDWLLLSAVPSYLSFANLGVGDVSGSDMTVRVAAGDRQGALETFQSLWALLVIASITITAATSILVWWVPWQRWMHLSSLSNYQAAQILLTLAIYVIVGQQCGLLESGFRCDGNYALGTAWGTAMRFIEAAAACLAGVLTGSMLIAACVSLFLRCIATLAYALLLYRKSPWLRLGLRHVRIDRVKQLVKPAFGFMAMPLGYSISLQGFTLIIGSLLGPVAVTAFSTLRTMTRVNFQFMTVIAWAVWPELSTAFGSGDLALARRLHRHAYRGGLALSLASASLLWVAGPSLYHLWIHGAVPLDNACFHVLLLVTVANSLWFVSSVVPMSTNAHHRLAIGFVIASCLSLALAIPLISKMGLTGAACALLLVDVSMLCVVLRASLAQLQDSFRSFLPALAKFPSGARLFKFANEA